MKQKGNYRNLVLAACFFIMAVAFSIVNSIHSIFISPVAKARDFSVAAFSLVFTIGGITTAVTAPMIGKLLEKVSIKLIMTVGVLLAGVGFAAFGFAKNILAFYFIEIIAAIGVAASTTIPISTLLSTWFSDKKGRALGIAFAGIGSGTFFWMQVASRLISSRGYSFAYITLGLLIVFLLLPPIVFIIRFPQQSTESIEDTGEKAIKKKISIKELKSSALILFSTAMFLLGITVSGTKIHIQPYLASIGHSLSYNANVGSTQAFFSLLGNLLGGFVFDKVPLRIAITIFSLFSLGAYAALVFSAVKGTAFIYAMLFGLFLCLAGLLPSYAVGELFKERNYAVTLGVVNMFFTLGSALGPALSGIIADLAGYSFVWLSFSFIVLAFLLLVFISVKAVGNQKKKN